MKLPQIRPMPAEPQMVPMPAGPRSNTISPKMLKRIWAAPPPVAQPMPMAPIPRMQRPLPHVAESFAVFVPGADDFGFGVGGAPRTEGAASGEVEPRNTEGGDEEGDAR